MFVIFRRKAYLEREARDKELWLDTCAKIDESRERERQRACQSEEENDRLKLSLDIADREVHRLMDVITEQAAEIRRLQEEASDYRNEINEYQERVKYLETFISAGEGI